MNNLSFPGNILQLHEISIVILPFHFTVSLNNAVVAEAKEFRRLEGIIRQFDSFVRGNDRISPFYTHNTSLYISRHCHHDVIQTFKVSRMTF